MIYDFILKLKEYDITKYANKWYKRNNNINQIDIKIVLFTTEFKNIAKVTDITKLRDFQYKLLLGKIFTNKMLFKWKKVDTEMCDICKLDTVQTVDHLLFECSASKKIWSVLKEGFPEDLYSWNLQNIKSNLVHDNPCHILNLVTLSTKYFIFQHKCLKIKTNISKWKNHLKLLYQSEMFKSQYYGPLKCKDRWDPVHRLLKELM